jgi:hypothetical protein
MLSGQCLLERLFKAVCALLNLRPFAQIFDPFGKVSNRSKGLSDRIKQHAPAVEIASNPGRLQKRQRDPDIRPEKLDQRSLILSTESAGFIP